MIETIYQFYVGKSEPPRSLGQLAVLFGADASSAIIRGSNSTAAMLYGADQTSIILEQD